MAPKKAAPATALSERSTRPRRGAAPALGTLNVTALQRSNVAAATDDTRASASSPRTETTYNVNMVRSLASDMSGVYPLRHCTGKNFLDLPGEIRNFIYELAAVRSKPVKLLHGTPSHIPTRPWKGLWPRNLVHGTRWLLNLAHTCRQIRAEYMPICLRDTAVEIMGYEINKYLDTFVKPQVMRLPLKDVLGNVTLSLYIDKRDPYAY
jgi:hypothetical protein